MTTFLYPYPCLVCGSQIFFYINQHRLPNDSKPKDMALFIYCSVTWLQLKDELTWGVWVWAEASGEVVHAQALGQLGVHQSQAGHLKHTPFIKLRNSKSRNQCSGSITFWRGSGSGAADPCLWLMDPDSDPVPDADQDPAIFVIYLQDANKKLI